MGTISNGLRSAARTFERYARRAGLHGRKGTIRCPFHDDRTPSLSVDLDKGVFRCFGCGSKGNSRKFSQRLQTGPRQAPSSFQYAAMGEGGSAGPDSRVTPSKSRGLNLEELARSKQIPAALLRQLGVRDAPYYPMGSAVAIPYLGPDGAVLATRYRLALDGPDRFRWKKQNKPVLYGLDQIEQIRQSGWVLLVEGESDCWTARFHSIPVLGIPGKGTWSAVWTRLPDTTRAILRHISVYLWQEPDANELPVHVAAVLPDSLVIRPPAAIKDLSDAHVRVGNNVPKLLRVLKERAIPARELIAKTLKKGTTAHHQNLKARRKMLRQELTAILGAPDPIKLVIKELRRLGYGGYLGRVLLVYLAATSRLLKMLRGSMPVHTLLIGGSGTGKSYALKTAKALLPRGAFHEFDAASPRAMIYDQAEYQHKALIFAEADSLPSGEDNPAASALRNLLQDHRLRYSVTIRDGETRKPSVHTVDKAGPTVLITTATKRLPAQLDNRLFSVTFPGDRQQIRKQLLTQANIELGGSTEPERALVAYQEYLQTYAPWDVKVPFAQGLADAIGRDPMLAPRANRHLSRVLSLIKAVTILRHRHRTKDTQGRWSATLEDYRVVYLLVSKLHDVTRTSALGEVSRAVDIVRAIARSGRPVTKSSVARELRVSAPAASWRIERALESGWLINQGHGRRYDLKVGPVLPLRGGLPLPATLRHVFNGLKAPDSLASTPLPLHGRTRTRRAKKGRRVSSSSKI